MITDQFLIKFALSALVVISFALQHASQLVFYKIKNGIPKDKNATYVIIIAVLQLLSIGIIIEIISYALNK